LSVLIKAWTDNDDPLVSSIDHLDFIVIVTGAIGLDDGTRLGLYTGKSSDPLTTPSAVRILMVGVPKPVG
jgi:hypothetical protein